MIELIESLKLWNFEALTIGTVETLQPRNFETLELGDFEKGETFYFHFRELPPPLNAPTPTPAPAPLLGDTSGLGGHEWSGCIML